MHVARKESYLRNKCALYSFIWGQCSENIQAKIKTTGNYKDMVAEDDSLQLLKAIKRISYKFETQENIYIALHHKQK